MTSYIIFKLIKCSGSTCTPKLYPIKVGGYTGRTEPVAGLLEREERAGLNSDLVKAIQAGDEVQIEKIERQVFKTAVKDVQTAFMAFFPHVVRNLVPKDTRKLYFYDDKGNVQSANVKLDDKGKPMIRDWQTSKAHPSRVVWFEGMPFSQYSYQQVAKMIDAAVRLFSRYTLKLTERKRVDAVTFPHDIRPTFRGMSGEIKAHRKKPHVKHEYRMTSGGTKEIWVPGTKDRAGYWRAIGKKV